MESTNRRLQTSSLYTILTMTLHCYGIRSHLGVIYAMDHEVFPGPCKNVDWLLNSFQNHFSLHQRKSVRVIMEVEVPKRHILMPA